MSNENIKTAVFVDYEHWKFGLLNQYKLVPDIKKWIEQIKVHGNITDVAFYYDFSNEMLKDDYKLISRVTTNIINTQSPNGRASKDYTDFVMLDAIYQKHIFTEDIDQFILFTGDGHFNSVVTFLTVNRGKTVGVYSIKGSLNSELRERASWHGIVDHGLDRYYHACHELLKNICSLSERQGIGDGIKPTFKKTIDSTENVTSYSKNELTESMKILINGKYIKQVSNETVTYLEPDWEKIHTNWDI